MGLHSDGPPWVDRISGYDPGPPPMALRVLIVAVRLGSSRSPLPPRSTPPGTQPLPMSPTPGIPHRCLTSPAKSSSLRELDRSHPCRRTTPPGSAALVGGTGRRCARASRSLRADGPETGRMSLSSRVTGIDSGEHRPDRPAARRRPRSHRPSRSARRCGAPEPPPGPRGRRSIHRRVQP